MQNPIFQPLTLPNSQVIKNRIFKSAIHEAFAGRDNQPNQKHVSLFDTWAQKDIGTLVTGNVMIDRLAIGDPGNVVVDSTTDKGILRQWAQAGKQKESKILLQLNHPGKQAPKSVATESVAPSAVPIQGPLANFFHNPRVLSTEEVKNLVKTFVTAAKISEDCGFSGVQIHAAHGYLINQFLSAWDNHRQDKCGGNLLNRMPFLLEIYDGMRAETKSDFIISVKINSSDFKEGGFSQEDSLETIKILAQRGTDLIEISGGSYEKPKMHANGSVHFLDFAKEVANSVEIPIVLTRGISTEQSMIDILTSTRIAMVGLARPLVLNPDLVGQIKVGNYQAQKLPRLSTGLAGLDSKISSMIGLTYCEQQMHRLAKGKKTKWTKNAWPALLFALKHQGVAALLPKHS